jgi:hypothetical protein
MLLYDCPWFRYVETIVLVFFLYSVFVYVASSRDAIVCEGDFQRRGVPTQVHRLSKTIRYL